MTNFEFVFSLYSLLFGLALTQVFAGFGNTLQERHKIRVGWLTPLLGFFVILDLTSFWAIGWELRNISRPAFLYLVCGVLLAGIYYLAARLVFPRNLAEWADFDTYYFRHKQWVFGGILFCNIVAVIAMVSAGTPFVRSPLGLANDAIYFTSLVGLLTITNKRVNVALLIVLLAKYAVVPVLGFVGFGMHGSTI